MSFFVPDPREPEFKHHASCIDEAASSEKGGDGHVIATTVDYI
jgi:hypothetical protein